MLVYYLSLCSSPPSFLPPFLCQSLYSPQHTSVRPASTSQKNHSLCFWNLLNSSGERYSFNRSESAPLCLTFHAILLSVQFLFPLFHTSQPPHPLQTFLNENRFRGIDKLARLRGKHVKHRRKHTEKNRSISVIPVGAGVPQLLCASLCSLSPFLSSDLAVFPSLNIIVPNNLALGCVTSPQAPKASWLGSKV